MREDGIIDIFQQVVAKWRNVSFFASQLSGGDSFLREITSEFVQEKLENSQSKNILQCESFVLSKLQL